MGGRIWARRRRGTGSEFGFALRHYEDVDDLPGADDGPKLVGVGEAAEAVGGSGSNDSRPPCRRRRARLVGLNRTRNGNTRDNPGNAPMTEALR